jgi:hypothetical protein
MKAWVYIFSSSAVRNVAALGYENKQFLYINVPTTSSPLEKQQFRY